jgi:hypothetical protein
VYVKNSIELEGACYRAGDVQAGGGFSRQLETTVELHNPLVSRHLAEDVYFHYRLENMTQQ